MTSQTAGKEIHFEDDLVGIMNNDLQVLMGQDHRYGPDMSVPTLSVEEFLSDVREEDRSHEEDGCTKTKVSRMAIVRDIGIRR